MSKSSKAIDFPTFYNLPPFYSLQPVLETREKQSKLWSEVILKYCEHERKFVIVIAEEEGKLFSNSTINRKLNREAIYYFLDDLVAKERGEWLDKKSKESIYIYWKTPMEWADKIQKWVDDSGVSNTVCTFFELLEGETGEGTEFHGMNKDIFKKALKLLEKRGKAEMFQSGDNEGVKFL
ncbi:predicted protein [Naegleria gruberi]|uniref:Vacuolar protein-sorting-associated protein 25 n=1 Tax=Naegleria gruberi TaxID=5762 RepID=D2VLQ9_NAEGR|nr:uncharacterized protein NAEGRDRAFT_69867 [Naegleria gruberi]EFC42101.1 predicted protein [Naegleria gruberi]|eukprot:XP_002674845.1 predicted protein [Naegleria gruberi strain NEG-M]